MSSIRTPEYLHGSTILTNQQVQSNHKVMTNKRHDINWRDNYIRTKLYAHQDSNVDQSAYDALVVSLLLSSQKARMSAGLPK